jgi:hypothetical protein
MPVMNTPVYIKEVERDRIYEGKVNLGEAQANFKLTFKTNPKKTARILLERIVSGENPEDLQGFIEQHNSLEITSGKGRVIPIDQNVRDVLCPQIYLAYFLLVKSIESGESSERTFELPLGYDN